MTYHLPVLAQESVDALQIQPNGVYVDVTFGGGGHSRLMLEQLGPEGRLLAFDQDPDAKVNVPEDERLTFFPYNFRFLKRFLKLEGIREVDGVLADLGVSSHQFDSPERGFSYRFDAELDMRMGPAVGARTAADVLNTETAERLQQIFGEYGEVRNAKTLALRIAEVREQRPFQFIADLLEVAEALARGNKIRYLSQVFQALRIEVNDEMGALEELLHAATDILRPGGRLVVISYHSLEDRMVKHFMKTGNASGEQDKDFYGNIRRPYKVISKKALVPNDDEIQKNTRARSARLRVAEKRTMEE